MSRTPLNVYLGPERLLSDDRRVILRYLSFGHPPRVRSIFKRLMKLSEQQVADLLAETLEDFAHRHHNAEEAFLANYALAARHFHAPADVSEQRRLLIGSSFTLEYSFEAAALFNPSMVLAPCQEGVAPGHVRFLLSLRATGEGHISSIVFRMGELDEHGRITLANCQRQARTARPDSARKLNRDEYARRLGEIGIDPSAIATVMGQLSETFDANELRQVIRHTRRERHLPRALREEVARIALPAAANYELQFDDDATPCEIVIFPASELEWHGMEDLRLVRFVGPDGAAHYYGTYTAYDGKRTYPMLIETGDFKTFHVNMVSGRFARDKGWALLPRLVGGQYMMLSRHDGESLYLMRSDDLYHWSQSRKLLGPKYPWEIVQIGNCGSPLETPRGWILLTHGVGPMRRYSIGAALLDLEDPSRVLGRLKEPLIAPLHEEREGHVPNVVYSCGSMIHNGQLVIPYAMSDSRTGFAAVSVDELVDRLLADGP